MARYVSGYASQQDQAAIFRDVYGPDPNLDAIHVPFLEGDLAILNTEYKTARSTLFRSEYCNMLVAAKQYNTPGDILPAVRKYVNSSLKA